MNVVEGTGAAWWRRVSEAVQDEPLSELGLGPDALRKQLEALLRQPGGPLALMADPVVEARPQLKVDGRTLAECVGDGLLHPDLLAALGDPDGGAQAWPAERSPYRHQVQAWQALGGAQPRSVLVCSGTGSGKTECFLVPLLDRLARLAAGGAGGPGGVRAILLYPLNALIASQRDRLLAWTRRLGVYGRFGLYNSWLPLEGPASPGPEVTSRRALREDPPPILVTNPVMLEYLLLRPEDEALRRSARGALEWIILDEVHTYLGTPATDLALLLRRLLRAVEVDPGRVRFVATSATLPADRRAEVRALLAGLSGQDPDQILVVEPEAEPLVLPALEPGAPRWPPTERVPGDPALLRASGVQALIRRLESSAARCGELAETLEIPRTEVMSWVDQLALDGHLPVRVHFHARGLEGVSTCLDPSCPVALAQGEGEPWLGALGPAALPGCPHQRFPLVCCSGCGFGLALVDLWTEGEVLTLRPPRSYGPDAGREEAEEEAEEEASAAAGSALVLPAGTLGLRSPWRSEALDPESGQLDAAPDRAVEVWLGEAGSELACPRCQLRGRKSRRVKPFWTKLGWQVPRSLRAVATRFAEAGYGRILAFQDGRQATARAAAVLAARWERRAFQARVWEALPVESPVPWRSVADALQRDPVVQELAAARLASVALPEDERGNEVAWLVQAEFLRRPLRARTLETSGWVQVVVPGLTDPPSRELVDWGLTDRTQLAQVWGDWLVLVVTFFLRARGAWAAPSGLRGALLPFLRDVGVRPPGEAKARGRGEIAWLEPEVRHRLTRLVVTAFALDLGRQRPALRRFLEDTWRALRPVLEKRPLGEGGWWLRADAVHLRRGRRAWICPVTGQLLPATLRGRSPFASDGPGPLARQVELPAVPATDLAAWWAGDPAVRRGREEGWLRPRDRELFEVGPLWRVLEHSAQVPAPQLREAERRFRDGEVRLLSCSTTLEMGVDLGGLSLVLMGNSPPSPARWLQRAGRVGRRQEALAGTVTFCRPRPLDAWAFAEPDWPFRRPLALSSLQLSQPRIVERHTAALLLSWSWTEESRLLHDFRRVTLGEARHPYGPEPYRCLIERLIGRLDLVPAALEAHYAALVAGTALSERPLAVEVGRVAARLRDGWDALEDELAALAGRAKAHLSAGQVRLARREEQEQKRRLGQSLVAWLVSLDLLPRHGFPMGELRLELSTRTLDAEIAHAPSRPPLQALREFAPGGQVVVQRHRYQPRGVILRPTSGAGAFRASRSLLEVGRCDGCGGLELGPGRASCSHCGTALMHRSLLLPDGYAVAWQAPVEWVDEDEAPPSPRLVSWTERLREGRAGPWGPVHWRGAGTVRRVVFLQALPGAAEEGGFATGEGAPWVCLRCGWVGSGPAGLPHPVLRGEGTCSGTVENGAISTDRALGWTDLTDAVELRVVDTDRAWRATWATALRLGGARLLGLRPEELEAQIEEDRLFILDAAEGGAGLAQELDRRWGAWVACSLGLASCSCAACCPRCLLDDRSEVWADLLDRRLLTELAPWSLSEASAPSCS